MPSAADGSFEQLLMGMTQLRVLELVDLNGPRAMCVFQNVMPTLLHLEQLVLTNNEMGPVPAMKLAESARLLPALRSVYAEGNDLEGALDDLNWIIGFDLFQ